MLRSGYEVDSVDTFRALRKFEHLIAFQASTSNDTTNKLDSMAPTRGYRWGYFRGCGTPTELSNARRSNVDSSRTRVYRDAQTGTTNFRVVTLPQICDHLEGIEDKILLECDIMKDVEVDIYINNWVSDVGSS
jgi:hypothetical protein